MGLIYGIVIREKLLSLLTESLLGWLEPHAQTSVREKKLKEIYMMQRRKQEDG